MLGGPPDPEAAAGVAMTDGKGHGRHVRQGLIGFVTGRRSKWLIVIL